MERPGRAASYREIAACLLVLENMRRDRLVAEVLDGDRIEIGEEGFAGLLDPRLDDLIDKLGRDADFIRVRRAQGESGAHDLADRDLAPLARQFIAAPRPAHPLENVRVNQ